MDHVCTHLPHLDLVDFGQNVSTIVRLMVSCNSVKKKFKLFDATPCNPTFSKMCPISALVNFFFHFKLHTLRQYLD